MIYTKINYKKGKMPDEKLVIIDPEMGEIDPSDDSVEEKIKELPTEQEEK